MESTKIDKRNRFFYIVFKCFTYDILFYYTLETMFLTLIKGFSFSQVFLITSLDLFFITILALPLNYIFKKVSILNRLRIGTLALIVYLVAFLFSNNIYLLCSFIVFKSIGNLAISINSTNLLDVICKNHKNNEVSKLEGRATALWWIMEAVSAIAAGYFFVINPFISYYICIGLLVLALISTFFFKLNREDNYIKTEIKKEKSEKTSLNITYKKLVIAIVIFAFAFWGAAQVFGDSAKTFLQEIGTSSVLMGWIYFGVKVITAGANIISHKIERKLGWKFLPITISLFMSAVLLMGVIYFIELSFIVKLILLSVVIIVMYVTRNPYRLNIKNTMTTYFQGKSLEKVFSYYFVAENLGGSICSLIASLVVDNMNLGFSILINWLLILVMIIPSLISYVKNLKRLNETPEFDATFEQSYNATCEDDAAFEQSYNNTCKDETKD